MPVLTTSLMSQQQTVWMPISASLKKRGIRFYLTEHSTQINDQLRQFGIGHMIKDGMVRRTILAALHDAGIEAPYELEFQRKTRQSFCAAVSLFFRQRKKIPWKSSPGLLVMMQ